MLATARLKACAIHLCRVRLMVGEHGVVMTEMS